MSRQAPRPLSRHGCAAAGIAALPYTNALLGWPLATAALLLMAYATLLTLQILVRYGLPPCRFSRDAVQSGLRSTLEALFQGPNDHQALWSPSSPCARLCLRQQGVLVRHAPQTVEHGKPNAMQGLRGRMLSKETMMVLRGSCKLGT